MRLPITPDPHSQISSGCTWTSNRGKSQQSLVQKRAFPQLLSSLRMSLFTLSCNRMVPPGPYTRLSLFSPQESQCLLFSLFYFLSYLCILSLKGPCISQNIYSCKWWRYNSLGRKGEPLAHIPGHSCPLPNPGLQPLVWASTSCSFSTSIPLPTSILPHSYFFVGPSLPIGGGPWPQCPRKGAT